MASKSYIRIMARMFLIGSLPLILCSCRQPLEPMWMILHSPQEDRTDPYWWNHPPKVDEIIPPKADTNVKIVIDQKFPACSLRTPSSKPTTAYTLSRQDLSRLLARQQAMLRKQYMLTNALTSQAEDIQRRLAEARVILASDFDALWRQESENAYRQIVRNILTVKQRDEYRYRLQKASEKESYHGRYGEQAKRDVIWSWLFLDDSQRQKLQPSYLKRLAAIQKARTIAAVLGRHDHRQTDALLIQSAEAIHEIISIVASHAALIEQLAQMDRQSRDALRNVTWLESKLPVEKNPVKKMRLRKAIEDNKSKSKELILLKDRDTPIFNSYGWKMEDLLAMKKKIAQLRKTLLNRHRQYCTVMHDITAFDGVMSSQADGLYRKLLTDIDNE